MLFYNVKTSLVLILLHIESSLTGHFKLTILHINNAFGRFDQILPDGSDCTEEAKKNGECIGGFARIQHVVETMRTKAEKKEIPPVIFLCAGDVFKGSVWTRLAGPDITIEAINMLKPDAIAVGGLDFNANDIDNYTAFLDNVKSPIISCNINKRRMKMFENVTGSIIIEKAGKRIGIVGYTSREISDLHSVWITDELRLVQEEIYELENQGVNILIALGSAGLSIDKSMAEQLHHCDVIVGGMSATFLYNGKSPIDEDVEGPYPLIVQQHTGRKVLIVQASSLTRFLGDLTVTFCEEGRVLKYEGNPIYMANTIKQDDKMQALVDKFRGKVEPAMKEIVGYTKVYLDGRKRKVGDTDSNFGNLLADSFVTYVNSKQSSYYWANYPIAFFNRILIQQSINATMRRGKITLSDLLTALPFGEIIQSCSLQGEYLLKTLEISLKDENSVFEVAGLKIFFDMDRPYMQRLVKVKARCGQCPIPRYVPIDPKKIYNITTTSYLLKGMYSQIFLRELHFNPKTYEDDYKILIWYLKKYKPVYPHSGKRIARHIATGGSAIFFIDCVLVALSFLLFRGLIFDFFVYIVVYST